MFVGSGGGFLCVWSWFLDFWKIELVRLILQAACAFKVLGKILFGCVFVGFGGRLFCVF